MMERSVWKNRLASAVLAGVMGLGLSFTALPMPRAHADVLGAILAGVQGVAIYGQVDTTLTRKRDGRNFSRRTRKNMASITMVI